MSDDTRKPQATPGHGSEGEAAIDRITPTQHPRVRAVMRQSWRDLLFVHWACDPDAIRPLIPAGLELDVFEGRAYVGLVPFTMTGVRPVGFPSVPWLSSFHETNVRTYVHRGGRDPGVWFFSLDAANPIAVRLARRLFHLPYHDARMFLEFEKAGGTEPDSPRLDPLCRRAPALGPLPASYLIRGEVIGPIEPAQPGTLEHFLAERYLLYSRRGRAALPGAGPSCALPLAEGCRPLARREPAGRRRHRSSLRSPPRPLRGRSRRRSLPSPPRNLIAHQFATVSTRLTSAGMSHGRNGISHI